MVKKIRVMTAALAGAAAFYGGTANAADSITFDTPFPSAPEVLVATPSESGFGDDANVSLAQTFTVTNDFSAQAIYLAYENDENANVDWTMTVTLFAVTNVNAATLVPDGTNLFTGTFTFPAAGETDTTIRIDMDTPVPLSTSVGTAGYAVQIKESTGADFNPGWEWLRPTAEAYAGGVMYEDGVIKKDGERDLCLAVDVAPTPTAFDDEYILPYKVSSTNMAAPGVLANDVAYDSAVLISDISSGTLLLNADGSFECSDLANGSNTFTYAVVRGTETSTPATVLLFASLEADVPIVVDDTYVMDLTYGDHIEGNVLNNDTNTSAVFEMYALLGDTNALSGTLTFSADGEFFYIPNDGFSGSETFTYQAYTIAATSEAAVVTLIVEEADTSIGTVIDSFEIYTNDTIVDVQDLADASLNWDSGGSGAIEIHDRGGYGPDYQYMKFGWSDARYRGAISTAALFSGISDSSSEYWLYCELFMASTAIDGLFGLTTNSVHSVSTSERGDFTAGVRFYGDGSGTLDLYAFSGGGATNEDVLISTGLAQDSWYGVWLNINNAANTYDVYLGDAGDAGSLGTQVGDDISFNAGSADLVSLLISATETAYVDNIIEVNPDSFVNNEAAELYSSSLADNDTIQLSISLNDRANAADYWPISCGNLSLNSWDPVAHSDAPDGTFAVTNLSVAGGDSTNKVIYIKATNTVEFIRIENNQ